MDETELNAQITDLTAKLAASEPIKVERDTLSTELKTFKDSASTHNSAIEALQAKLTSAEEQAGNNTEAADKLTSLQESHTSLETRFSEGIKSRLKGHGLVDDVYKDKSLAELEAMDVALSSVRPTSGVGNEEKAGITGSSGSGGSIIPSGLQVELDIIEKARNRGR